MRTERVEHCVWVLFGQEVAAVEDFAANISRPAFPCCGEIATPLNDMGPEDATDNDRPEVPTPRTGHPTEIASIIRYLASDETGFINGASYDVDGGMVVGGAMSQGMYRKAV